MEKNILIVIYGLPATGKTTFGKKLSQQLNIPIISRDDIKESLFNTLGYSDREWSRKLGGASFSLLFHFAESIISTNHPLIIESNFQGTVDRATLLNLKKEYSIQIIEIHCICDETIRKERFVARNESGTRHPGHVDHLNYAKQIDNNIVPSTLNLGDIYLEFDTTHPNEKNFKKLLDTVKNISS